MIKTKEEIGKAAALNFIGDDEGIKKQFVSDIEVMYYAPHIIYFFQTISKLFLEIFISAAGAYILYTTLQKPNEEKFRQQLIMEVEAILKKHEEKLNEQLELIKKIINKFDDRDKKMIKVRMDEIKETHSRKSRREIEKEIITNRKKRLQIYKGKSEILKSSTNSANNIIELLEEEYKKRG